ncbi:membrane-associated protein, putative [Bodo saltans]|uniref:Membrane-associated protein, putative n=1 Tax=Bodo saltans TaxID=75058 RepID=A0A0S4KH30_BODSA|nr:membrane-associated protein, putative [Bodo saltans]|eukprot:CUI14925.1 membrane-associated protein, putative [Bodo saltans]
MMEGTFDRIMCSRSYPCRCLRFYFFSLFSLIIAGGSIEPRCHILLLQNKPWLPLQLQSPQPVPAGSSLQTQALNEHFKRYAVRRDFPIPTDAGAMSSSRAKRSERRNCWLP